MRRIKKLYQIGELMEYSKFSRQMLNHYTEIGLIKPRKYSSAGHRLYNEEVFARLSKIAKLKQKGYTLKEIESLLNRRGKSN